MSPACLCSNSLETPGVFAEVAATQRSVGPSFSEKLVGEHLGAPKPGKAWEKEQLHSVFQKSYPLFIHPLYRSCHSCRTSKRRGGGAFKSHGKLFSIFESQFLHPYPVEGRDPSACLTGLVCGSERNVGWNCFRIQKCLRKSGLEDKHWRRKLDFLRGASTPSNAHTQGALIYKLLRKNLSLSLLLSIVVLTCFPIRSKSLGPDSVLCLLAIPTPRPLLGLHCKSA